MNNDHMNLSFSFFPSLCFTVENHFLGLAGFAGLELLCDLLSLTTDFCFFTGLVAGDVCVSFRLFFALGLCLNRFAAISRPFSTSILRARGREGREDRSALGFTWIRDGSFKQSSFCTDR